MASKSLTLELFGRDVSASSALLAVSTAGTFLGTSLSKLAFGIGRELGEATRAVVDFGADSIRAFAEAETAQTRLAFAFEKFPTLAGGNIQALRDLDTQLQKTTRFEDDATAAAQGQLAMYDLNADQLTELTPLLLDYAAATGKTAGDAAEDLGKAILGQGRALKAVGLNFKDAGNATDNYTQLVEGLRSQVQGFAEKDAQTVSGRLDILKNQFNDIQEKLGSAFAPALGTVSNIIDETLLPALDGMVGLIGPQLESALADSAPKLQEVADKLAPLVENFIAGAASDGIPAFIGAMNEVADAAPGWASAIDFLVNPETSGIDNFNTWLDESQRAVSDFFKPARQQVLDWADDWNYAWDSAFGATQTKSNDIKSYWRGTVTDMKQSLIDANMYQAGYDFVSGFALGISDSSYLAEVQAENMALRTVRSAKNAARIASPSKAMRELGKYMPQGFALGIEDEMWRVDNAFSDMIPTSSSMSVAARVPSGGGGTSVIVNVNGAVGNEDFLAKTVVRAIQNSRGRGQTSRGSLV